VNDLDLVGIGGARKARIAAVNRRGVVAAGRAPRAVTVAVHKNLAVF
jgi:hypothetical protein